MRISDWSSDVCSSDLEAAAAVAALVAAVAGLHDDGGTFLQRFDAHRQIADDVVAEAQVALQLVHRRRRGVDAQHDVVALAVLLDAVGQGAQTPVPGARKADAVVVEILGAVSTTALAIGHASCWDRVW